ncbi:ABC transporter substrate-binding protein [Sediminispirochaeta smaragdinae]|uniref:Extracellular solute-binding protein family 1 n=1 Tax=Sediminispirochaeta smaragdinae (strain DSM 11293 / JCM 15392 / SEBR 4228) TaxID=573413 RepID=E1R178_SEDSS|nr:ABC transporter substrate-binding protein [Sediminispirochaeta smaragdinae]ADK80898.1 extracellular solute-binding protein family 1 [Sediminispirochaeta smaragdinae DSM 11293]
MKRKSLSACLLVLSLLLLGTVGIGASGSQEKDVASEKGGPIEITFWSLFTGGDGEFFDAMVDEFNRTHDDIVMTTDTVKFDNYYTKLTTALTSQNAPDVVVIHRSKLLNYVPSGTLYPLDDVLKSVNAPMDDFIPAALEPCTFDGKIYSLPLDVHALIMYYNKDLFRQAGIAKVPVTYEEFVAAAKKVQDKTGAMGAAIDNTTATYKAYTLTRLFMSFMEQQGGSVLTEDLSAADFNNEMGEKALQALVDMVRKYGITESGLDYDSSVAAFKLGKAAIHINGVWATGSFEKQEGLDFAAVPLPAMLGKPAAWSGSHTLAIPAKKEMSNEKLAAAVEFMLWMTERGDLWAKAGHIPIRKSVSDNPDFQSLPHRKDYAAAAASSFAAPRTVAWDEIYNNLSDSLELAVASGQDVKTALAEMEKMVNSIIASY